MSVVFYFHKFNATMWSRWE